MPLSLPPLPPFSVPSEVQFSRLDAASVVQQGVSVLGSDDDGRIRIQASTRTPGLTFYHTTGISS